MDLSYSKRNKSNTLGLLWNCYTDWENTNCLNCQWNIRCNICLGRTQTYKTFRHRPMFCTDIKLPSIQHGHYTQQHQWRKLKYIQLYFLKKNEVARYHHTSSGWFWYDVSLITKLDVFFLVTNVPIHLHTKIHKSNDLSQDVY